MMSKMKTPNVKLRGWSNELTKFVGATVPDGKYMRAIPSIIGINVNEPNPIITIGIAMRNLGNNIDGVTSCELFVLLVRAAPRKTIRKLW